MIHKRGRHSQVYSSMYARGRERRSGAIGSVKLHNVVRKDSKTYQLFLQFYGPTTILLQTRASRIRDVLTSENVNEVADTEPGVLQPVVTLVQEQSQERSQGGSRSHKLPVDIKAPRMSTASIGTDGKVIFEPTGSKI